LDSFILVVAAVFHRKREVALLRRGPGSSGCGHWEFPGGKVEAGESESQALQREIHEELGVRIEVGPLVGESFYRYPAKNIHLRFYWVKDAGENFVLTEHDAFQWIEVDRIDLRILSEGDREIVKTIQLDLPRT